MIPSLSKNHTIIRNFCEINHISKTENSNGTFINLAILDEDKTRRLYELISKLILHNHGSTIRDIDVLKQSLLTKSSKVVPVTEPSTRKYKCIHKRKKIDKQIIELSKMYHIQ